MLNSITGIILAGGKSTRIGTNKAFLKISEKAIIEEVLGKLKSIFKEVLIIANEKEKFDSLRVNILSDIIPSKGPLGGIYTGLVKSRNFYNFFVACDMPFLNINFIKFMLGFKGYDVVMPQYNNRFEPLCAIYSKACINPIEKELSSNSLKITDFFRHVKVKTIGKEEIARFDSGSMFTNINTWGDYDRLTNKVGP